MQKSDRRVDNDWGETLVEWSYSMLSAAFFLAMLFAASQASPIAAACFFIATIACHLFNRLRKINESIDRLEKQFRDAGNG